MSSSDLGVRYCHIHPKRETMRSCSRCDRPTCNDCLRDAPVGQHCIACLKEAQPSTKTQAIRTAKVTKARATSMSAPITRVIVAINAIVFVYTELMQKVNTNDLAVFASNGGQGGVAGGEWWRLVTSGFIHFGIVHIGFNMYALWNLGHSLEPALGRWRYVGLYFVSLLGGSFGALLFKPFGYTGGASGAVFGLIAAATLAARQRGIPFNNTWGPMLVINLIISYTIPGISMGGHLGGMVFGGVAGAIMMHPKLRGKDARRDLAMIVGLGLLAVVLAIVVSKTPINGTGLWPRN
jgi:membrane associated rhomboid family serine protease